MTAPSVLVVEDDPTLVNAIARNLAVMGYAVRSATTVSEAVTVLREKLPSLLLLDISLPDGSGWEVLHKLRASGWEDVPVIVISVLRPNPRVVDDLQVAAVLEKPFSMDSLLHLVAKLTDQPWDATVRHRLRWIRST